MADDVRIYTICVCITVALVGTPQLWRWMRGTAEERLHWLATVAINLAILLGTFEALRAHADGGIRVYLVAVAMTWLLAAVLYRPVHTVLERHRPTNKEKP